MMKRVLAFATLWALFASGVCAEEGGSGHYIPGSMASFADTVPPSEAVVVRYNYLTYDGSFS